MRSAERGIPAEIDLRWQTAPPQSHPAVNAASAARHNEDPVVELGPLSTAEKQGYGCLIAGGASLVLTALSGTGEVVALFTGATALPASDPTGVGLVIVGTVFASTCAVGALVAPTVLRLWRYYYEGAELPPAQTP